MRSEISVEHTCKIWKIEIMLRCLTLYHIIPCISNHENEDFEKTLGKGENADIQHFLLFPTMFSSITKTNSIT